MKEKTRIFKYDFIRAFAIVTVVANHILTKFANTPIEQDISEYINTINRFSVPVFLFLAGNFFRTNADLNYLKKKFLKVLIPYSIISIPAMIYTCIDRNWNFSNLPEILLSYVFGDKFGFFFVFLILSVYLVGYFFVKSKLIKNTNLLLLTTLFIHFIWLAIDQFVYNESGIKGINFFQFNLNNFLFYRNILTWIFFFVLGIWYQKEESKKLIEKNKLLITIGLIASFVFYNAQIFINFGDYTPYGSIIWSVFSTLIILFLLNLNVKKWKDVKCIKLLSEQSFSIYLIHYFFVYLLVEIEIRKNINFTYSMTLIFFPAIILASLAVIHAVKKIAGENSKWIVGS